MQIYRLLAYLVSRLRGLQAMGQLKEGRKCSATPSPCRVHRAVSDNENAHVCVHTQPISHQLTQGASVTVRNTRSLDALIREP